MKTRIGVDVDGVIRDFSLDLHKVIKEHYPEYIINEVDTPKEMTDWDLENSFNAPKEEIQRIYREEFAHNILSNGTPIVENVNYLREQIKKDEHTFIAVTSQHPICCHHTLSWLGKQELGFSSVVFKKGKRKWEVEIDYLVDDSPNNYHAWVYGRQMEDGYILMNQPWNEKVKAINRVNNIKEAMELINE